MSSKRERYERANMRGGMGVRKRLSEESLRETYRLNGVQTGSTVARCLDRYGRWEQGYVLGVIVRKTASVVQIRWLGEEDITTYNQGDARYEVDRGRWRILGVLRGNPLDPDDNALVDALTAAFREYKVLASASADDPTPPTEETESDMSEKQSQAAAERAAAQRAVANGDLKERDTYTAKQIATRLGTDAKTMRKFFRSNHSTVEPVGQGGRYEFAAEDVPKIKREFAAWRKKAADRAKPTPKPLEGVVEEMADAIQQGVDSEHEDLAQQHPDEEPTDEELAELEEEDIDLDDLDEN